MQNPEALTGCDGSARPRVAAPSHRPGAANKAEPDARSTATYIAQMTAELVKLARYERLDLLSHLLEMAKLEAELRVKGA